RMGVETYNLLLTSLALGIAIDGLRQQWKSGERLSVLLILGATTIALIAGQLLVRSHRAHRIVRARSDLREVLGPEGRPFDDLQLRMNEFSTDELREAVEYSEDAGAIRGIKRQVHDPVTGIDYTVTLLVPTARDDGR